jgi:hypothetical protein
VHLILEARVAHLGSLFRLPFSMLASFAEIGFVCGKWQNLVWRNPSIIADITIRALSRLKLVLPARWPCTKSVGSSAQVCIDSICVTVGFVSPKPSALFAGRF